MITDEQWVDIQNRSYDVLKLPKGTHDVMWAEDLASTLQNKGVHLVVLNACESARRDNNSFQSAGVASALLKAGIPYVIAMQLRVNDEAAITFSETFYGSIAQQRMIEESLAEARKAVSQLPERSQDWGIPVLYMRSIDQSLDHHMFAPESSKDESVNTINGQARHTDVAVNGHINSDTKAVS